MTLQIDAVGWKILELLQENARLSYREIGEAVGLTAPAVAERVRRMEDAGIVKGYHAEVDLNKAGLPIQAFVLITNSATQALRFRASVHDFPEVTECYCITGSESYIVKVAVTSVPRLEQLLMELKPFGEVRTCLVLSSQLTRRTIHPETLRVVE